MRVWQGGALGGRTLGVGLRSFERESRGAELHRGRRPQQQGTHRRRDRDWPAACCNTATANTKCIGHLYRWYSSGYHTACIDIYIGGTAVVIILHV